jgi:sulfhydrogenase subunit alpha
MTHRDRTLAAKAIARVEGEGAMYVRVSDGRVEEVRLDIYEPPRFFEAFLAGRAYTEPPDITARICGICPVAYQTSACQAIEAACGISLPAHLADLRRLLYCGEWISSHALHIYMLHAPDFLGYPGAVELARDHREIVERGLALRRVANSIMETIGGRSVHPVNVRVGGFYRVPAPGELGQDDRTAADRGPDHAVSGIPQRAVQPVQVGGLQQQPAAPRRSTLHRARSSSPAAPHQGAPSMLSAAPSLQQLRWPR